MKNKKPAHVLFKKAINRINEELNSSQTASTIQKAANIPQCFLEEITGQYVLIFPSGKKLANHSKSKIMEIARGYGAKDMVFKPYREIYDPTSSEKQAMVDGGIVMNVYKPSIYQQQDDLNVQDLAFPKITALIKNVLPDKESREAFINWLAVIFNTGQKTGTAWVVLGSQGSGKTLLFERVITPLLGAENCTELNQDALTSRFNQLLDKKQMVCFNEVHSSKQAAERIKTWITEDKIRLEDKSVKSSINHNYLNLFFTSNSQTPVSLDSDDRRFNVVRTGVPLTEVKWFKGDETIAVIELELSAYAKYLHEINYSVADARQSTMNDEKRRLIEASVDPLDRLVDLLRRQRRDDLKDILDEDQISAVELSELSDFDTHLTKELMLKLVEGITGESISMTKLTRELRTRGIKDIRGKINGAARKREYSWQGPNLKSDKLDNEPMSGSNKTMNNKEK